MGNTNFSKEFVSFLPAGGHFIYLVIYESFWGFCSWSVLCGKSELCGCAMCYALPWPFSNGLANWVINATNYATLPNWNTNTFNLITSVKKKEFLWLVSPRINTKNEETFNQGNKTCFQAWSLLQLSHAPTSYK
jgi:hypothetical protein